MVTKGFLFVLSVITVALLAGCGAPELASTVPQDTASGVLTISGQGIVSVSSSPIKVTYTVDVAFESGSQASITPAPVAISTTTAVHSGNLEFLCLYSEEPKAVYLYYSDSYTLTGNTTYTVTIEQIWNRRDFMGMSNKSGTDIFSFTTE